MGAPSPVATGKGSGARGKGPKHERADGRRRQRETDPWSTRGEPVLEVARRKGGGCRRRFTGAPQSACRERGSQDRPVDDMSQVLLHES